MKASEAERSSGAGAYERLLQAIEEGELAPGSRLREADLAERFQISRTPVREALGRLEAQGLVAHEPHRGASVARLDYGQVSELYDLREVLEGTAARLAAIHASAVETEILEEMVARDRTLLRDAPALARTNRLFHRQIHGAARNRFLQGTLETMRLSLVLLPGATTLRPPTAPPNRSPSMPPSWRRSAPMTATAPRPRPARISGPPSRPGSGSGRRAERRPAQRASSTKGPPLSRTPGTCVRR